jgi:hypothetical protein
LHCFIYVKGDYKDVDVVDYTWFIIGHCCSFVCCVSNSTKQHV